MESTFLQALGLTGGIVCAAGAGGKKSALYALARQHPGRVALTATVPMAPFPPDLGARVVIGEMPALETDVARAARHSRITAYAGPSARPGRYGGIAPATVTALHARCGFDLSLVKADGARMREVKAPREGEPNLPPETAAVLFVVSVQAVGRPLDERCAHRVQRLMAVTGAAEGAALSATHLARLLASPDGALKGAENATVIPVINKVDDSHWLGVAHEVAVRALALTQRFDRVLLTALNRAQPLVECVCRNGESS